MYKRQTKSGQEGKARIDIKYNHSWGTLSHKVPQANRKERLLDDQYRKEYFETYGGGNPDESSDTVSYTHLPSAEKMQEVKRPATAPASKASEPVKTNVVKELSLIHIFQMKE